MKKAAKIFLLSGLICIFVIHQLQYTMTNIQEIWLPVKGYEGLYEISSFSKIRSYVKKQPRLIFGNKTTDGYMQVTLTKNLARSFYGFHQLMAIHFIPNPENKPYVNHKNGIKTDNSIDNLEWCTPSENCIHRYRVLKKGNCKGEKSTCNKPIVQLSLDGFIVNVFYSRTEALQVTKIRRESLYDCLSGKLKSYKGYLWM